MLLSFITIENFVPASTFHQIYGCLSIWNGAFVKNIVFLQIRVGDGTFLEIDPDIARVFRKAEFGFFIGNSVSQPSFLLRVDGVVDYFGGELFFICLINNHLLSLPLSFLQYI